MSKANSKLIPKAEDYLKAVKGRDGKWYLSFRNPFNHKKLLNGESYSQRFNSERAITDIDENMIAYLEVKGLVERKIIEEGKPQKTELEKKLNKDIV